MVNVFHHQGISKYLDAEDMIRLLQCGSSRLNRVLRTEAVALRFSEWHTRFADMFRLFRFLAKYFSRMYRLEMDFRSDYGVAFLSHKIPPRNLCMEELDDLMRICFPNLAHLIVRETQDNLVLVHLARFFNSMEHATTTIFPILQTFHIDGFCVDKENYDAAVYAFVNYTPVSVTCLKLQLLSYDKSTHHFDIKAARADKPKISLASLTLKLRDTPCWDSIATAYNLNDLVVLNIHLPEMNHAFECGILPKSLQHLEIGGVMDAVTASLVFGVSNAPKRSIIHIKNAPIYLESMTFYNIDVVMQQPLPSMLSSFRAYYGTVVHDEQNFIAIPLLPRNLTMLRLDTLSRTKSSGMLDYLFVHLMHQAREYVESVLKQWPPRLSLLVDRTTADWLCPFAHMPELALITTTSQSYDDFCSIHQYALAKDDNMDMIRRRTLEELAAVALQSNPHLRTETSIAPRSFTTMIETVVFANVEALAMSYDDNTVDLTLCGESESRTFTLENDNDIFGIIPTCVHLRHLVIQVSAHHNMDAILSSLPCALHTLAVSFTRDSLPSIFNIKQLNAKMRLRYLDLAGLLLDPASLTQLVRDIKAVPLYDQPVLSTTIASARGHTQRAVAEVRARPIAIHIAVHCHSVDASTLESYGIR